MKAWLRRAASTLAHSVALGLVQLGGMALVAFGLFTLAPWLGLVAGGAFLCIIGWALDGED